MTNGASEERWPVLKLPKSQLVFGPKVWVGCIFAAAIIVLGVVVTPSNGWAGLGIGIAAVLGAFLGFLFQTTPRERDFTANGASAVRGLLVVAEEVENAQILVTQLVDVAKNQRVNLGLIDVQDRMSRVRASLYNSMAEWDAVAPGSLNEVSRLRDEGKRALDIFSKEIENDA